jgi:hypothetical protein
LERSAAARWADNSVTDCAMVAGGDGDSTGEGEGEGDDVEPDSASAVHLELRQSKQISAHKILFRELIDHHRTDVLRGNDWTNGYTS